MGGRIYVKHGDPSKPGGMNLTKAAMLTDFMFSPMGLNLKPKMYTAKDDKDGIKRPSTAMEHLEMFSDDPKAKEFISLIREDSGVMKTYNTYVKGFLSHLRSDGRFHPTYYLFVGNRDEDEGGAKTGRLSCKDPAFQTVPKHTKWAQRIRRCFPAPPGYVVVERDYGQGELRVIACIAHEDNMIAVFKSGKDIHADTAAPFAGFTYEALMALEQTDTHTFEETRQLGKAGNFGLVFGMKEDGFVNYARSNYGVTLTWDEAHEFRETFFKKYPKLLVYHRVYVDQARQHKQVRTPLGRIRHLPLIKSPNREVAAKAERQAINSPVQGCLTDMVLWTIALEHQSGLAAIAPCFGACHDSILNYVPEDLVEEIVIRQIDQMENLPFEKVGWNPQLKFAADAKIGPNWGEVKKFKRSP
jgi:DNA polymerase I-like protein with 3'-5' exonuclease and polymerase domains